MNKDNNDTTKYTKICTTKMRSKKLHKIIARIIGRIRKAQIFFRERGRIENVKSKTRMDKTFD